jgi:hypothetical protein
MIKIHEKHGNNFLLMIKIHEKHGNNFLLMIKIHENMEIISCK